MADTTTLDEAKRLVAEWQKANNLLYLSPRIVQDLAERIERALVLERTDHD